MWLLKVLNVLILHLLTHEIPSILMSPCLQFCIFSANVPVPQYPMKQIVLLEFVNILLAQVLTCPAFVHMKSLVSCSSLMNFLHFHVSSDYLTIPQGMLSTSTRLSVRPLGLVVEVCSY